MALNLVVNPFIPFLGQKDNSVKNLKVQGIRCAAFISHARKRGKKGKKMQPKGAAFNKILRYFKVGFFIGNTKTPTLPIL